MKFKALRDKFKPMLYEYWPFILLFVTAAFLRFYKISYAFSVNGVDEGIHLMTGRLAANDFGMYTQMNTMQGPLFMWIYELLDGNIIAVRSLSAVFSLFGVLGACIIAYRIANKEVALLAGVFMAFNYYFIKEGRLASIDLFASVLLIWAFVFLLLYLQKDNHFKRNLLFSGLFFALASMTKLFVVIPLICVSVYLVVLWLRRMKFGHREALRRFMAMAVFGITIIVTTVACMSIYGIETTFKGIFLDNLYRPEQSFWYKIGMFAMFTGLLLIPFIFAYLPVRKHIRKREVQMLLIWAVPLLLLYLFQSLTWIHHYTLIVAPVCILGSWGVYDFFNSVKDRIPQPKGKKSIDEVLKQKHPYLKNRVTGRFVPNIVFFDRKRAVIYSLIVVFVAALIISNFVMVLPVKKPVEYTVAEDLEKLTTETDFIISGDPLITDYADRLQPPEAANLAMVKFPPVTCELLVNLTVEYNVKAVVFTYNLSGQMEYIDYIQANFVFYKAYDKEGFVSTIEGEIPIATDTFNLYLRPGNYSLPDE